MYDEKEENRKRIALKRANQTKEEIDYYKIVERKRQRGLRAAQLAKEHLLQNLAAKKIQEELVKNNEYKRQA